MSIVKTANKLNSLHNDEEYYNHVPGSTRSGAIVGAVTGSAGGSLAGLGASKSLRRLNYISEKNPEFKKRLSNLGNSVGIPIEEASELIKKTPSRTKSALIGSTLGGLAGALSGSYKGMLTGVGMNDRQYLLERNLTPDEVVKNSVISSLQMNSSGSRISNAYNQGFGHTIGSIRRARMKNAINEELHERGVDM